jgi:hypothetical protein
VRHVSRDVVAQDRPSGRSCRAHEAYICGQRAPRSSSGRASSGRRLTHSVGLHRVVVGTPSCRARRARALRDGRLSGSVGLLGVSQTKHASSRSTATTTVVRFFARAASRSTQRRCSRICARHAASIAAGGWPSWRRLSGSETRGGRRYCHAASTRRRRACALPAFVIAPWRRLVSELGSTV